MWREDRDSGKNMGKAPLPKSSWRESRKLEKATGTELKREKEEGLNSIKTVNRGSAESATPQFNTWQCSGGKGESPGAEWGPRGSQATQEEAVPLPEEHLVEAVRKPGPSRLQRMATLACDGTKLLRVKPGARCVF